ncbi:lysin A [Arthrobacter phage Nandita]|uniref:Lysin A n=1 Tax=Arthrobacter phage Nandita TaxID=2419963 RepID=A0A3G2KI32_9CAUD|nr:lysin A [Arthrobacter phage Nandita]AYN58646.1 lysin A [Arthrobacter phage Nandita]
MTYMYPFPRGVGWKSQAFGANPNNGVNPVGGHTGDDWAVPVGTPVHAAADGIIRNSSWLTENYLENPWWLTQMGGDTLVLDAMDSQGNTDNRPTFVYAHLADSTAPVGAVVRKGDVIGISGNTGTATTGPHCHAEVLPPAWDWNNGTFGRVNPEWWFDEYPTAALAAQSTVTIPVPVVKKESEMPAHKTVSGTLPAPHRLPKGKAYRLSARDDGTNQNFAVNGAGQYSVTTFVRGTGLPAGRFLEVTYEIVTKGKISGYDKQFIRGTESGDFSDPVVFDFPILAGQSLNIAIESPDLETAKVTGFRSHVRTWKA